MLGNLPESSAHAHHLEVVYVYLLYKLRGTLHIPVVRSKQTEKNDRTECLRHRHGNLRLTPASTEHGNSALLQKRKKSVAWVHHPHRYTSIQDGVYHQLAAIIGA